MARTVGSHGPKTLEAIRKASLQLIYDHGFDAMSLRQLAAEVGIQVGSLYNHISTKEDLLFDLIKTHMEQLLSGLDSALSGVDDSVDAIRRFVSFHVAYHIRCKREVFVGDSELRSLVPHHYEEIVALRRAYERRLIAILERGAAAGQFTIRDSRISAYGILAMLTGVCTWFRPNGRLTAENVSAIYSEMVVKSVAPCSPQPAR